MKKILQREVEVAFSRHAQPVRFRVVKYIVLVSAIYLWWNSRYLWWRLAFLFVGGVILHLFYRYKTKGWTRSYGAWNYQKNQPKNGAQ